MLIKKVFIGLFFYSLGGGCTYTSPPSSLSGYYANNCTHPRESITLYQNGSAIARYKKQKRKFLWNQKGQIITFIDQENNKITAFRTSKGHLSLETHPRLKTADRYVPIKEQIRYKCHSNK